MELIYESTGGTGVRLRKRQQKKLYEQGLGLWGRHWSVGVAGD